MIGVGMGLEHEGDRESTGVDERCHGFGGFGPRPAAEGGEIEHRVDHDSHPLGLVVDDVGRCHWIEEVLYVHGRLSAALGGSTSRSTVGLVHSVAWDVPSWHSR